MDEHTLFTILIAGGAACILSAIVGGGVSLNVVSIPSLSRPRQILLAVFGLVLVAVGFWQLQELKQAELPQGASQEETQASTGADAKQE